MLKRVNQNIVGATEPTSSDLPRFGIKIEKDGFLVANRHPELTRIFQGTLWEGGAWATALRRLPGAYANDHTRRRFSNAPLTRCTFIPFSCLEDDSPQDG